MRGPASGIDETSAALLGLLLDCYPAQVADAEVLRLFALGESASGKSDDVAVALDDLVGHGLAHRHGAFVFASVAAVRFNDLGGSSVSG